MVDKLHANKSKDQTKDNFYTHFGKFHSNLRGTDIYFLIWCSATSPVIMQKGESQNGRYKKTKHAKFSEKRTFLTPDTHTCAQSNIHFSENLVCFVFLQQLEFCSSVHNCLFVYFNPFPYTTSFLLLLLTIKSNGWN